MPRKKAPTIEVGNAKVVDLRAFLKEVGLDSKGNKPELEKRVKDYLKESSTKGKKASSKASPKAKASASKSKASASKSKASASKSKASKSKAASADASTSVSESENFAKLSVMELKELVLKRRKDVKKSDFDKYKFQKPVLIDFLENGKKAKWPEEKKTAKKSSASASKSKSEKSTKSKSEKKKASPKKSTRSSKSKASESASASASASAGGKYDELTLAQLKKECKDRKLNIAKSCATKKVAIASLEAFDAGQKEGLVFLKEKPSKSASASKGGRGKKKASAASSQESSEETPASESESETPKTLRKPKTPPKSKTPPKKAPPKLPPKGVRYMERSELKDKLDDMGLSDLKSEVERRGLRVPKDAKRDKLITMITLHNQSIKDCAPEEFLDFRNERCLPSTPHFVLDTNNKKIYSSDRESLETLRDTVFGEGTISEAEHRESIMRLDIGETDTPVRGNRTPPSKSPRRRTPPPKPPKPNKSIMDLPPPPARTPPRPRPESSSSSEEELDVDAQNIVKIFSECLSKQA